MIWPSALKFRNKIENFKLHKNILFQSRKKTEHAKLGKKNETKTWTNKNTLGYIVSRSKKGNLKNSLAI